MSARCTVAFTTLASEDPAASSVSFMLRRVNRVSRSIALPSQKIGLTAASGATPVLQSVATWPARNSQSPTRRAGEYPASGIGMSAEIPSRVNPRLRDHRQ